jgi:hypothetical protein
MNTTCAVTASRLSASSPRSPGSGFRRTNQASPRSEERQRTTREARTSKSFLQALLWSFSAFEA